MNKFCDNCDHWQFVYDNGMDKIGTCDNISVEGKIAMATDAESKAVDIY